MINQKELKELFAEFKNDNQSSYEMIYNKCNKLVYGIAFSILKNKQDAEDITQTVFAKIYEIDKEKLPVSNEASWLYTITKNEALTYLKKKHNEFDIDNMYEIEADDEINKIIDKDSYNRLISKLDNKEKEIISLKVLGNLSFEQISKILNEPTGTIKWRYYKAKHTLKLLLSNLGMFIISFVLGIQTLSTKRTEENISQDMFVPEDSLENKEENVIQGTPPTEENKGYGDSFQESLDKDEIYEDEKQEIIIEPSRDNDVNYFGKGMIGISSIFLIFTIFFTIIFTKHQLKRNKKPSK